MRWIVLILAVFLSGCIAHYQGRYQGPPPMQSTTLAQANGMVGVQQPTAYKVGFMAGCDSGNVSAGNNSFIFKKDVERFGKDDLYQQGWNDGFSRCSSGEGVAASAPARTYYTGGYYPGTYSSGYYYSDYYDPYYSYPYYSPGFSLWLGNYGRHDHYAYRDRHYSPWYGGRNHQSGGGLAPYIGNRSGGNHGVSPYIGKRRGGGHGKSYKGKGHKGGGYKKGRGGGGHKNKGHQKSRGGGGHKNKGLGSWIR